MQRQGCSVGELTPAMLKVTAGATRSGLRSRRESSVTGRVIASRGVTSKWRPDRGLEGGECVQIPNRLDRGDTWGKWQHIE
jgi:hypothetical protein